LYFRGGSEAENLSPVKISKDLRALGIGALRQHGALLPAVCSKCYPHCFRKEVTADTESGDLHHRSSPAPNSVAKIQSLPDQAEKNAPSTIVSTYLMTSSATEIFDLNKIVFNTKAALFRRTC
jgi:hypothetical protein